MDLPEDLCRERFAGARVARLATCGRDGQPRLVPVTFAVVGGPGGERVVSAVDAKPKRSRRLRRLADIAANPRLALLADRYDEDWSALWWVRVDGVGTVVDTDAGAVAALVERYPQYADQPPAGPVVSVTVTRWTGWAASG